ncbi:hypothetical protein ACZ75_06695 [Massilia sp. NR 4-1]|nr:hypothetical protein ACZ75_06695 [Massilia sp. NR 4-1]
MACAQHLVANAQPSGIFGFGHFVVAFRIQYLFGKMFAHLGCGNIRARLQCRQDQCVSGRGAGKEVFTGAAQWVVNRGI